jgi:PAS domain S-box-containing protein
VTLPRTARTQTIVFVAALVLSLSGVFALAWDMRAPAPDFRHLFWFIVCWLAAQILLISASISSFRASLRQGQVDRHLQHVAQLQQSILHSAGPMILSANLDGDLLVFNPAAERVLGYTADEVCGKLNIQRLFPEDEMEQVGQRLVASFRRSQESPEASTVPPVLENYVQYIASFPSSMVRGVEMQYRRKDGSTFPAMVHLAAVRSPQGEVTGIVAISMDLTATRRTEQALRESEERYRDLFENAIEMIATLSPHGQYLYVNPAWQSLFGISSDGFETLMSFESAFPPEVQAEAAALFRRALKGERVEREPLRLRNATGGRVEVEASLSRRQGENRAVSVRCILRDVTQQNRRERRLGMQLEVSQIVGESTSQEEALPKVLAALCTTLGYDLASLWVVDEVQQQIRFDCSWSVPDRIHDEFLRETRSRVFTRGQGLPGIVWTLGTARWMPDLRGDPGFDRRNSARINGLTSGWAVPVRVGNRVIAAVEFFSRQRREEDLETMSTVETVCASIGQFMARSAQESRVRELHQQNEFILNSVADGIFGADPEGRVDFVNPAAAEMLGASPSELAGRPVHSILHSGATGDDCGDQCRTRRAFLLHESTSGQDVFYRMDGSSFPVEFSVSPMMEHGVVIGSVLSFRDIGQRYALDRMKDEFVSTVSHELRTPLTSIRGALGLLSSGLLGEISDKAANLMRIAVSNSDRLVRLINDILDLERMQSGRAPLNFRQCALNELAQQVVDAMQPMADAASIHLVLKVEPTLIEADSDRILQVITNLLSNAIKFSPPDSDVRVEVAPGEDGATLSVIDNGRGIPTDKLESIFDRFQQVDASDSRQKGGTGLGLAICRTILQQHGGRIWAEQNADRGATFRIFLPERSKLDSATEINSFHDSFEHEDTVLICEGDSVARGQIVAALRKRNCRILEAENCEQAVHLSQHFSINAILLGISPQQQQDGWQTLRALKEDPATSKVPIVVLSLLSSQERPAEAQSADAWIQEPLDETLLLAELARVLQGTNEHPTVLLVEDDEDLARVILDTFERDGIVVYHAPSLRRAIEVCGVTRPHLIILDLALPDGDGLELVDWLRTQRELRYLPLVVYSAREVSDFERKRLQLGPTQFLTKTKVQPREVEALVFTMLRHPGTNPGLITGPILGSGTDQPIS